MKIGVWLVGFGFSGVCMDGWGVVWLEGVFSRLDKPLRRSVSQTERAWALQLVLLNKEAKQSEI